MPAAANIAACASSRSLIKCVWRIGADSLRLILIPHSRLTGAMKAIRFDHTDTAFEVTNVSDHSVLLALWRGQQSDLQGR